MRADVRIGVSGWTYSPWRGVFYPQGLAQKHELRHAATTFNALEVNGTFYGLQRPESFGAWAEAGPSGFLFAIKGPRFVTHILRLRNADTALANFFASGPLRLGAALGPFLWQFPPNFRFEPGSLEAFLSLLPRDTLELAALAGRHDHRLVNRAYLQPTGRHPVRHAIEIRHESFRSPEFIRLLRRHNVALVCADTVAWPRLMDLTADFVYCRLHGGDELYRSRYAPEEIERWARRVEAWSTGAVMTDGEFVDAAVTDGMPRDTFFFFDNTDKLHAPDNAQQLMRRLGVASLQPGA